MPTFPSYRLLLLSAAQFLYIPASSQSDVFFSTRHEPAYYTAAAQSRNAFQDGRTAIFQFKGQRQTTSRPVLLFLLIVHECPSPSSAFPLHYTASPPHFQARTANSTFIRCFLLYSAFCICPIRPSIRHSIHPVPKTCEFVKKISLKSCQPLDKSLTICYTVLVTPTNTDIPRSRAHPRRTDEA